LLLTSGVVAAIVGGIAGFVVARLQRTWDLDARQREDRRARLRAAVDVINRFMDSVDLEDSRPVVSIRAPVRTLTNRDWWDLVSVGRLFGDLGGRRAAIFYPDGFLDQKGDPAGGRLPRGGLDPVRQRAAERLAVLTSELEKLGDPDLHN
jgi:hypothetical protein